jgi:cytochrome P450
MRRTRLPSVDCVHLVLLFVTGAPDSDSALRLHFRIQRPFRPGTGRIWREGVVVAIEVRKISLWHTLCLLVFIGLPAVACGLVAPRPFVVRWLSRWNGGSVGMRFLQKLRRNYGCDHLWTWFPLHKTLLVLNPETIEAVLRSSENAADPWLKKRPLSRFVPDALVISSGPEWVERRQFNKDMLDFGHPHRHRDAFREIVIGEVDRLSGQHLRWADFQGLGDRISQQIVFGAGQFEPETATQLAGLARCSNWFVRHERFFSAFYAVMSRHLSRSPERQPMSRNCLMHDCIEALNDGKAGGPTRVTKQVGFWLFVIKDAVELHVARTLALIAAHPAVQAQARQDIHDASTLTPQAIDGLQYLGNCIREQLRLWTPVPILLRRAVQRFSLCHEIAIEAEQQILIHSGFYHRDAAAFGKRADEFLPDSLSSPPVPALYSFSGYRQSCVGESLAMFLLKSTLARLLERFQFELIGPKIEPGRVPYLYDHFGVEFRLS